MIDKFGNMWDVYDGVNPFLITTNSFIKSNGGLVMGRGIAKQAMIKYPQLPAYFGTKIDHLGLYSIRVHVTTMICAFQVKYHFKDKADIGLITTSCQALKAWADMNTHRIFNLNYPGVGNGKLKISQVAPILASLPDNVHIWRFKK